MQSTVELLDKFACLDLVEKVRRAADDRDAEAFSNAFTDDAVWTRPSVDPMVGREAIGAAVGTPLVGQVVRHIGGGADAVLTSEDTAVVISQATIYSVAHDGELPAPVTLPAKVIEYRDELVRTPEGWRIRNRVTTWVFSA